jgi:WD40 repeat protein
MAVGDRNACHLELILRNTGNTPVRVEDFSINGVASSGLPTAKVLTIEDPRWWSVWPNPVPAGGFASFKARLVDGPATLGDAQKTQSIILKTDAGEKTLSFKAEESAIWMPFVHFSQDLKHLTVFVGNRGNVPVPVSADRMLAVNGKPVRVKAPVAAIAPGEVLPLDAELPEALAEGGLAVIQVSAQGVAASASLRALPSSFGATYWFQVKDFDPADLAARHIRTDIPGSVCFMDEPIAHRVAPMSLRDRIAKSWESTPERPAMAQKTACLEVQLYAGLPDIVMTHHQWDNRDLELAAALNWPRPVWYLPQNAWGRTEQQTRHYKENFYPLADLDREAYEGLAHGAKNIQWFSMQTLWWQNRQMAGGTDLARTEASVYFPGALSNPAVWDRTGRMSALLAVLEPFLANSAPAFKDKIPPGIEVSTLVGGNPRNAVVIAVDAATNLNAFYKSPGGTGEKLQSFDNLRLSARVPAHLKADSAYLVSPYAGVSRLPFQRRGNSFETVIPKFEVGAAIVLGNAADGAALADAWKQASAGFARFADAPGSGAVRTENVVFPAWQHGWPGDERCRDAAMSDDGSRLLVARGRQILCFDEGGKSLWQKSFPGEVLAARFGRGGRIYAAANLNPDEGWNWTNTHILALDPDGNEVWKYPVGGTVFDIETGYDDGGVAYGTWGKLEKLDASGSPAWQAGALFRAFDLSSDKSGNTYFSDQNLHRILDSSGAEIRKWREPAAPPHEPNLVFAASADGARTARGGYTFSLHDETGAPLVNERIGRTVRVIAFTRDGSAVAAGTADGALRIYDRSGKQLADQHVPGSMVADIRPLGDDRFAVAREIFSYETDRGWRYRDTTEILDRTGKRTALIEGPWRTSPWMVRVSTSADGKSLAVSENESVRFYRTADPQKPNTGIHDGSLNPAFPDGWTASAFGTPRIPGSARFFPFDNSWVLSASGNQWDRMPSSGYFVGTQVLGDNFSFTVRVRSIAGGGPYRSGGILVANGLAPSETLAAFFFQPTQKTNRVYFRNREGGNYQSIMGEPNSPHEWLRVERSGNALRFSVSKDGSEWTPFGEEIQIPLGSDTYAGLIANADAENATVEAVFDQVRLERQ